MSESTTRALSAAVLRLLRPLVRLLLRHGMPYGAFADLAKRVFVEVALKDYAIPGRKPSISRVAILTGLSRKEVQRVLRLPLPDDAQAIAQYNRAARVLTAWARERDYVDAAGNPLPLPLEGEGPSFARLVRQFSGDVPPRAILDELLRVGAVRRDAQGRLHLLARAYVPQRGDVEKIGILGTDAQELLSTLEHNLTCAPGEAWLQRKVAYDNLPVDVLPALRRLAAAQGQALLEELDRWLAARDRDTSPAAGGQGRARASIGIYYFEERLTEEEAP
ncbi:MAG: hypothetical protein KatS3mg131_3440 [Candidatus Tectimicrobiota bacterium]|nr:MAG: hypothetical protein KatS3mg131_3440 [Candidatus Tectomicrobia bacterium]